MLMSTRNNFCVCRFRALAIGAAALVMSTSAVLAYRINGPIKEKYDRLGGPRGTLGPVIKDVATSAHGGTFNVFRNGLIVWHRETGAHMVRGNIFDRWHQLRGADWAYPMSDETTTPDGKGKYNHFRAVHLPGNPEYSIYSTTEFGAHEVVGPIRARWAEVGWERWGWPVQGERTTDNGRGRLQEFRQFHMAGKPYVSIVWTPQTGSRLIYGEIRKKWKEMGDIGAWQNRLGHPASDEFAEGNIRRQNFEHGFIRYSSSRGAIAQIFLSAGECTPLMLKWGTGIRISNEVVDSCNDVLGMTALCNSQDSFVAVNNLAKSEGRTVRRLFCSKRHRPLTPGQEVERIARGVAQGLSTAYTAAAPFVSPTIQGVSCVSGVIYSCAVLALDVTERITGAQVVGVGGDAMVLVDQAKGCANGDIGACAKIGARGAARAGLNIPGHSAEALGADGERCKNHDQQACERIGKAAVDAAGVKKRS